MERAKDLILSTFLNEETKFKETVEKGLKILEEEVALSPQKLDGEIAFKLYDTYGFPLDLTQDYLRSKNIEVDIDSFNIKMKEQKDRARQSWKGTGDIEDQKKWFQITENLNPTEFLGYEQTETESEIISIIKNDTESELLSLVMKLLSFLIKHLFMEKVVGKLEIVEKLFVKIIFLKFMIRLNYLDHFFYIMEKLKMVNFQKKRV